jgi:hypothetical protein
MLTTPVHIERGGAKLRPHWDLTSRSGPVDAEASRGFGTEIRRGGRRGLTGIWCLIPVHPAPVDVEHSGGSCGLTGIWCLD